VDAPWSTWFNPNDGLSQWITPQIDGQWHRAGGTFYRTAFPIPPIDSDHARYVLTTTGQVITD
jgi:hypothetical protein